MAALTFTAVNFIHSFNGDYVALCLGKGIHKMADRKLCACIADDLPNDVEVASVGIPTKNVAHLICIWHLISGRKISTKML